MSKQQAEKVTVDVLLNNGVTIALSCKLSFPLKHMRDILQFHCKSLGLGFHFVDGCLFTSINSEGYEKVYHDEDECIGDLGLGHYFFQLQTQQSIGDCDGRFPFELASGYSEEKYQSNADIAVARSRLCRLSASILKERADAYKEFESEYAFDVCHYNSNDTSCAFEVVVRVVEKNAVIPLEYRIKVKGSCTAFDLIKNVILQKLGTTQCSEEQIKTFCSLYWLQACGLEEKLIGKYPLVCYQYIQSCIEEKIVPCLHLIAAEKTSASSFSSLEKVCYAENASATQQSGYSLWSNEVKSLGFFKLTIGKGSYLTSKEGERFLLNVALVYGAKILSTIHQTESVPGRDPDWHFANVHFDVALCDIPRGTKLCLTLIKELTEFSLFSQIKVVIGWCNISLFDMHGRLIQGRCHARFWPLESKQLLNKQNELNFLGTVANNPDCEAPCVEIELPSYRFTIIHPSIDEITAMSGIKPNIRKKKARLIIQDELVEADSCSQFYHLVEKDPFLMPTETESVNLWQRRTECVFMPNSLPLLVNCVDFTNHSQVIELYELLEQWPYELMDKFISLRLLDAAFPDPKVRLIAVRSLDKIMKAFDCMDLCLQLVQALKYEFFADNYLARFVLKHAIYNRRFFRKIFWFIRASSFDPKCQEHFEVLLDVLWRGLSDERMTKLNKEVFFVKKLEEIQSELASVNPQLKTESMKELLSRETYASALQDVQCVLNPSKMLGKLIVDLCKTFSSSTHPMLLVWNDGCSISHRFEVQYRLLYKSGNDLRYDITILQVFSLLNCIWKDSNLNMSLLCYDCICTGDKAGILEIVKGAKTVMEIQKECGLFTQLQFDNNAIVVWLRRKNPGDKYTDAVELFTRTCAAYTVATYILGIGDRHPDNIMIAENGQMFHIDFAHILGDFKYKYGIKRERTPMVITPDFMKVITNSNPDPLSSTEFERFKTLCLDAFQVIRSHSKSIINFFNLLEMKADIVYETLEVGMDDVQANNEFVGKLVKSYEKAYTRKIDWAFHAMRQMMSR